MTDNPLAGVMCECCRIRQAEYVLATSVPYSAAYCTSCAAAGLDPYFVLVTNTACCNGLDNTVEFWQEHVKHCLDVYNVSAAKFEADVKKAIDAMGEHLEAHGKPEEP